MYLSEKWMHENINVQSVLRRFMRGTWVIKIVRKSTCCLRLLARSRWLGHCKTIELSWNTGNTLVNRNCWKFSIFKLWFVTKNTLEASLEFVVFESNDNYGDDFCSGLYFVSFLLLREFRAKCSQGCAAHFIFAWPSSLSSGGTSLLTLVAQKKRAKTQPRPDFAGRLEAIATGRSQAELYQHLVKKEAKDPLWLWFLSFFPLLYKALHLLRILNLICEFSILNHGWHVWFVKKRFMILFFMNEFVCRVLSIIIWIMSSEVILFLLLFKICSMINFCLF